MEIRSERPFDNQITKMQSIIDYYRNALEEIIVDFEHDIIIVLREILTPERSALPDDMAGEHPC